MRCKAYEYWRYIDEVEEEIKRKVLSVKKKCPKIIFKGFEFEGEGPFYRFELDRNDRYPYFKSKGGSFKKRAKDDKQTCMMCGLSVQRNFEETKKAMSKVLEYVKNKFPNSTKKILICENLKQHGEVYKTPTRTGGSSHHTFFPCENYNPDIVWKVLEEI